MEDFKALQQEIAELKKEKNALVLAHYYVPLEVQDVADKVGDSFALAKYAKSASQDIIVMCGVRFMGESAKILSPDKTILLPDETAGCPMADMITPEGVMEHRKNHPEAAVVCYVNSSAAVKAVSDICCTSSSALKVVEALGEKELIFVPDMNLGSYVAEKVPEKTFYVHDGYCPIHHRLLADEILSLKEEHPDAAVAVHPECQQHILELADFIGSTAEILEFAGKTEAKEVIIGTESEIARILNRKYPEKKFYTASEHFTCGNMKKITLTALRDCLKYGQYEVTLTEEELEGAKQSLDRMVNI